VLAYIPRPITRLKSLSEGPQGNTGRRKDFACKSIE
jgi:hypothetical protein